MGSASGASGKPPSLSLATAIVSFSFPQALHVLQLVRIPVCVVCKTERNTRLRIWEQRTLQTLITAGATSFFALCSCCSSCLCIWSPHGSPTNITCAAAAQQRLVCADTADVADCCGRLSLPILDTAVLSTAHSAGRFPEWERVFVCLFVLKGHPHGSPRHQTISKGVSFLKLYPKLAQQVRACTSSSLEAPQPL